jgi:hypothetical protein
MSPLTEGLAEVFAEVMAVDIHLVADSLGKGPKVLNVQNAGLDINLVIG